MKKYTILIPIYNDRESLTKLIENVNEELNGVNSEVSILVINDASSQQIIDTYPNLENIHSFEVINMKQNRGHARCIASGLKYISENEDFDYVIPMDGDGEDKPEEIKNFVEKIKNNPNKSIVGERVKRSEGLIFKICYFLHKIITYTFTGKLIKFGNFTCLTKETVKKLINEKATWSSFSGSLAKTEINLIKSPSIRGSRYFGPSKMSFLNLVKHSLSIISVFKFNVIIRSILFFVIYFSIINKNISLITIFPLFLLILFLFIIFNLSNRENIKEFDASLSNIEDVRPH